MRVRSHNTHEYPYGTQNSNSKINANNNNKKIDQYSQSMFQKTSEAMPISARKTSIYDSQLKREGKITTRNQSFREGESKSHPDAYFIEIDSIHEVTHPVNCRQNKERITSEIDPQNLDPMNKILKYELDHLNLQQKVLNLTLEMRSPEQQSKRHNNNPSNFVFNKSITTQLYPSNESRSSTYCTNVIDKSPTTSIERLDTQNVSKKYSFSIADQIGLASPKMNQNFTSLKPFPEFSQPYTNQPRTNQYTSSNYVSIPHVNRFAPQRSAITSTLPQTDTSSFLHRSSSPSCLHRQYQIRESQFQSNPPITQFIERPFHFSNINQESEFQVLNRDNYLNNSSTQPQRSFEPSFDISMHPNDAYYNYTPPETQRNSFINFRQPTYDQHMSTKYPQNCSSQLRENINAQPSWRLFQPIQKASFPINSCSPERSVQIQSLDKQQHISNEGCLEEQIIQKDIRIESIPQQGGDSVDVLSYNEIKQSGPGAISERSHESESVFSTMPRICPEGTPLFTLFEANGRIANQSPQEKSLFKTQFQQQQQGRGENKIEKSNNDCDEETILLPEDLSDFIREIRELKKKLSDKISSSSNNNNRSSRKSKQRKKNGRRHQASKRPSEEGNSSSHESKEKDLADEQVSDKKEEDDPNSIEKIDPLKVADEGEQIDSKEQPKGEVPSEIFNDQQLLQDDEGDNSLSKLRHSTIYQNGGEKDNYSEVTPSEGERSLLDGFINNPQDENEAEYRVHFDKDMKVTSTDDFGEQGTRDNKRLQRNSPSGDVSRSHSHSLSHDLKHVKGHHYSYSEAKQRQRMYQKLSPEVDKFYPQSRLSKSKCTRCNQTRCKCHENPKKTSYSPLKEDEKKSLNSSMVCASVPPLLDTKLRNSSPSQIGNVGLYSRRPSCHEAHVIHQHGGPQVQGVPNAGSLFLAVMPKHPKITNPRWSISSSRSKPVLQSSDPLSKKRNNKN